MPFVLTLPRAGRDGGRGLRKPGGELYGWRTIGKLIMLPRHCDRDDIEVTPEVVEAGVNVLTNRVLDLWELEEDRLFALVVAEILEAGYSARPKRGFEAG